MNRLIKIMDQERQPMSKEKNKWLGFIFLFVILLSGWVLKTIREQLAKGEIAVIISNLNPESQNGSRRPADAGLNFQGETGAVSKTLSLFFTGALVELESGTFNSGGSAYFSSSCFQPFSKEDRQLLEGGPGSFDPASVLLLKPGSLRSDGVHYDLGKR